MDNTQKHKQQYIESAIISSKALAEGDHRLANKHAKIIHNIFNKFKNGKLEKEILVELLSHPHLGVSGLAAIDLLRMNHEVKKAEQTLERIVTTDQIGMTTEEKLRIFMAKIQLMNWKEKGYLT